VSVVGQVVAKPNSTGTVERTQGVVQKELDRKGEPMSSTPTHILRRPETRTLLVRWPDDHEGIYRYVDLRRRCCCAHCVHEITGEKLLDPTTIPEDLDLPQMSLVGNYAIKFRWSDGHDQGLYTWPYLRELCPCDACAS
jgi:DUF971 family protein